MTVTTDMCPIFENEEWLVTEAGLEHKTTGYFIERESLGQRREDGLWTWPLHMAEKSWCAMTPFAEAFSCAASVYDIATGAELARTFKVARSEISAWPEAKQELRRSTHALPRPLRSEARIPISLQPDSAEKPLSDESFRKLEDSWRIRPQTGARPFSTSPRIRSARSIGGKDSAPAWQASYRLRKTGTTLVRLLQAAWNIR